MSPYEYQTGAAEDVAEALNSDPAVTHNDLHSALINAMNRIAHLENALARAANIHGGLFQSANTNDGTQLNGGKSD